MFKINEYIIYNKDVCIIKEIKEKFYKNMDYYVLTSISDESLKLQIPINSNKIRELISLEELNNIIKEIPNIEIIKDNDRLIENTYKTLMQSGTHKDLIKIIKTTYLRNKKRTENNKKLSEIDDFYFRKQKNIFIMNFLLY